MANAQDHDQQVTDAIQYVRNLKETCVFDHGYQCAEIRGDDFLKAEAQDRQIPGLWLEAWPAALTALVTHEDLEPEQKQLRHYKIGFAEDEAHFVILFEALSLPLIENNEVVGIIPTSIGQSTKVWVDKKTLAVTDIKFLR